MVKGSGGTASGSNLETKSVYCFDHKNVGSNGEV